MSYQLKIKAMSLKEARQRAEKILDNNKNLIEKIEEISAPNNGLLGFFKKSGEYLVHCFDEDDVNNLSKIKAEGINTEKEYQKKVSSSDKQESKAKKIIKEKKKVKVNTNINLNINQETTDGNNTVAEKKNNISEKKEIKVNKSPEQEIMIKEKVETLIEKMGLDFKVEVTWIERNIYNCDLLGSDNGIIIGKKGKTLNSLEYLINAMLYGVRVNLDVEGFKAKRAETLEDLARKMSEKALKTSKTVRLNPMPPRERKIIHQVVNTYEGLDTYSEGRDPVRYIVIKKKRG